MKYSFCFHSFRIRLFLSFLALGSLSASAQTDTLIQFSSKLSAPFFYVETGANPIAYLYLEAKAAKFVPAESKRLPLNIALVLDRSGSMRGDKIEYVRRAANFVVENLKPGDFLSIVSYDDAVEVVFPSGQVLNKDLVKSKIRNLTDRGSTNLSGGMLEGFKQVKSSYKSGYVNRVLLLSDGLANAGITNPVQLQNIVTERVRVDGISLSTFGVGADFNEDLMTNLAEHGSGNYYFIETPDKIPSIFDQELKGLLSVVAQNMKLSIRMPAGIKLDKVFGYPYKVDKDQILVDFRDVFSEDTKGVLIRFSVTKPVADSYSFSSQIQFDDALKGSARSIEMVEVLKPNSDTMQVRKSLNADVEQQIILFEANEVLKEAAIEADKRNFDGARKLILQNSIQIKGKLKTIKNPGKEIMLLDSLNTSYETNLKDAETKSETEYKVMQKSSKSDMYKSRTKKFRK